MFELGLQLSTLWSVGPSVLPDDIQVQACMKASEVVKVNVALVCLLCHLGIKAEEVIHG